MIQELIELAPIELEYVPAGQSVHVFEDDAPIMLEYEPAPQFKQVILSPFSNEPAGQGEQTADEEGDMKPALHRMQEDEPICEKNPAEQLEH